MVNFSDSSKPTKDATEKILNLSGTLQDGDTFVYYNSGIGSDLANAKNKQSDNTVINFNGNDYVYLKHGDNIIDVIGGTSTSVDEYPFDGAFASDVTLVRNADVTGPSATYVPGQWTDKGKDYLDGLGTHTMNGGSGEVTVAAPQADPQAGTVVSGTPVTLSCTTGGAVIYYTLDGSDPSTSSTQYTAPFEITGEVGNTVTIKAIAIKDDVSSAVQTISYTIKAEAEMPIADGDQVVIYNPAYNMALSSERSYSGSFYNKGVPVTIEGETVTGYGDTEVWTVNDNGDGTWSFSNSGQNIGMDTQYTSMPQGGVNDDWELIAADNDCWYVKNTVRDAYIEWYKSNNNWSAYYKIDSGTEDLFELKFYKVTGDTPEPEPTSATLAESIKAGDIVLIYYPTDDKVMSTQKYTYTGGPKDELVALDASVSDDTMSSIPAGTALFKVYEKDGHLVFRSDAGFLYLDGTHVRLVEELGEYTYFDLEEAENGWFIKSTNAQYSGKPQYLEFYGGYFTCYGMNSGNSGIYTFQFYKAGTFDPDTDPLPDEGETAGAPFAAGDDIVIYAPSNNMALSSTVKSQYYPVGVAVTVSDDEISGYGDTEIWTVGGAADGWTFATAEGTTLSMGSDKYTSTYPGAGENETWVLEPAGEDGQFYIKNVGRGTYLWWDDEHDDWTTKSDQKTAVAFRIVERTDEPGEEVTGLEVLASPVSGAVVREGDTIELIAAEGATIYYTTDGSEPTSGSAVYTEPLTVGGAQVPEPTSGQPLVVKALAVMTGEDGTEQAGSVYTFTYKAPDTLDGYTLYFGQLHSHTDISDGTGSVTDAFEHAAQVPNLDFLAVTDHSNSFDNEDDPRVDLGTDLMDVSSEWNRGMMPLMQSPSRATVHLSASTASR